MNIRMMPPASTLHTSAPLVVPPLVLDWHASVP
jgi:hypothetical protein